MSKNSPTPWKVNKRSSITITGQKSHTFQIESGKGMAVALLGADQEANSVFIVKAVNCHEELLEACKGQHKAIDWLLARLITLEKNFYPSKSPVWKYLVAGNEAITKAEAL